jgi:hypothetical protein
MSGLNLETQIKHHKPSQPRPRLDGEGFPVVERGRCGVCNYGVQDMYWTSDSNYQCRSCLQKTGAEVASRRPHAECSRQAHFRSTDSLALDIEEGQ